jgi:hypothetical protein
VIAKVTRGRGPSGALRYLFGPGREAEHTDAHVVAASASLRAEAGLRPDRARLEELAGAMELPSTLFGTEVAGGPAWHLALSTKAKVDRDLTGTEWAEVAREAMCRLGFDGSDGQAPCRWVAVRHGRSDKGNDHLHIVVNLVREDGKVARTANDFRRLSRLCADMEARYGLTVVEGRAKKAAMPGLSRAEAEKAKRTKRAETEREELARLVRAAATVATSEADFVRLLRDAGLAARPRYDRSGAHRVVGYAVAEAPSDGGVAVFFGGGKLARDLSLPALRSRWQDGEAERQEAAAEWGEGAPAKGAHEASLAGRHPPYRWAEARQRWGAATSQRRGTGGQPGARLGQGGLGEAAEDLGEVVRRIGAVPADDVATWRAAASDAAGALAVLSGRLERSPGPLAQASDVLARSAQGPRQSSGRAKQFPRGTLKSVAALMAQADLDEGTPAAWRLLFAELLRVAQAVHDAHLARSEAEQAGRLAGEARKALEQARARLGSLEALRDELPEVFEAAQQGAVRAGEEEASRRRRRQRGQGPLTPGQLAATPRRPAPEQSPEVAR